MNTCAHCGRTEHSRDRCDWIECPGGGAAVLDMVGIAIARNNIATLHMGSISMIEVEELKQKGFTVYPIYKEQVL